MSKVQTYTAKGSKSGDLEFSKELIVKTDKGLMTQAFRVFEDRSHKGTSKVKTRSEVNATTRKIYRQKGTGGARHGDKKAPIFAGGGVAHGPKGVKRTLNISKKMNKLALKMFLSQKLKDKALCFVNGVDGLKKTKKASSFLENVCKGMGKEKAKKVLIVLADKKTSVYRAFRNIHGIEISYWSKLNLGSVYLSSLVIIDKDVLAKPKSEKTSSESKVEKTKK